MMLFRRISIVLLCSAIMSAPSGFAWASVLSPTLPTSMKHVLPVQLIDLPLQFEANHGQVDEKVQFLARGKGYTLFLTPTESVMVLQQIAVTKQVKTHAWHNPLTIAEPSQIKQAVVRMKLEGTNPAPEIKGLEQLPGIVNYFVGSDSAKWRTDIPTYAKVQYQEVYPGIDLAYYGNQGTIEYDFIVAPEADPDQIKLVFEGASALHLTDSGDLFLTTDLGDMRVQKPVIYQLEPDGHKKLVAGNYIVERKPANMRSAGSAHDPECSVLRTQHPALPPIGIQLAAYDRTKPLVIDPVLLYSSYLGGSDAEGGGGIAVDGSGQAYVTGLTQSLDFPTINASQSAFRGSFDAFVTKLTANGALAYSSYLGGSEFDQGGGIAVDGTGQAYVTGLTQSLDFPTLNARQSTLKGFSDAFVTKLTVSGALAYSTYLGGSDSEQGFGIAVDGNGQSYVTGVTFSRDFPTLNSNQPALLGQDDAFVTKLTVSGALAYSTYLGGSEFETGFGIAVDQSGQAYVTGTTLSLDFPMLNAGQPTFGGLADAFVTKLTVSGILAYSTYLGGNAGEQGFGIMVDGSGQAYITGETSSENFPTRNAYQTVLKGVSDAFVTKLTISGALMYSTYLGGSDSEQGRGIAVDGNGQAFVTGWTQSGNFPTLNASQSALGGSADAFVTNLTVSGTLTYSTYLGGSGFDEGLGIAVDGNGQAFLIGDTNSVNFPTLNASQPILKGVSDAFVTKLSAPGANQPPVCSAAQASPNSLWSPNHHFVPIAIVGVTDPDNDPVTITVTGVTQDEPVTRKGEDTTSPDAVIQASAASVRAERSDNGNGRVYRISFAVDDGHGGTCTGAVTVGVPYSLKKGLTVIDDGQRYTSTSP